ncbi:MAG TPA: cupin domain-containing protein [Rhodothermales bacterium]|nr:cupin domain-containing protein [Rhodothermales bacterium]
MANAGDELVSPLGDRLRFVRTARDTGGTLLEMEMVYRPRSTAPPLHRHPFQEERFEVLRGEIRATIGRETRTYRPGDTFVVPANVAHTMANVSFEEGALRWQVRPALDTETFFETMWGLARDGRTGANGVPPLLHTAVLMRAYRREFRLVHPVAPLLQMLFGVLAPLGRLRGYRARYERYSGSPEGSAPSSAVSASGSETGRPVA